MNNGWATHPYNGMNEVVPGIIETQPFPPPGQNAIGLYYLPILRTDWEVIVEWKAFREGDLIPNAGILFRLPDPKPIDFNNDTALKAYFAKAIEVQIDESGKIFAALIRHKMSRKLSLVIAALKPAPYMA